MFNNYSAPKRRILIVITSLQFGGAETQVVTLAQRLQARNWDVAVVSLIPLVGHAQTIAQLGIPVYTLGMKRGVPDPRAVLRLARIVREWQPDIVHSHMVHANFLARFARLFVPMRALVCTAHNTAETSERGGPTWHKELIYGLTEGLCDRTTIICQAAWQRYVQNGAAHPDRFEVIPIGIDCERFRPDPLVREALRKELQLADEDFTWLAVARLVVAKDISNLLRAARELKGGKWKLLIAGDGPLRTELEALTQQLSLSAHVRFLGVRRDLAALYNAADALVLSSKIEGLPLAVLEACASGLPSVVTDVGGTSEAVLEGLNGFVVPPGDSGALAKAMERMMNLDLAERREFALAARQRCLDEFEINAVVDRWEELYGRVVRSSSGPPKILYVITRAERGGAQIHVQDLITKAPPECRPVLVTGESGYLCDRARELEIPVHIISNLRQPISPRHDLQALFDLISLFRSERPALVHAHTSKAGLLCRLAGALTRTPVLFTAHTWSFADGISRLQRLISRPLERFAASLSGKMIVVSRANEEEALRSRIAPPEKLVTIANGVPDTTFRATPGANRVLTLVMVARFAEQKDHATLLEALSRVGTSNKWRLLFVGDGPTRQDMEDLAERLGIGDAVVFLGDRSDVAEILSSCDLFVLATNWEGLPLSILEAMRAGLPVISTDVGGCGEAVLDGVTGYLVPRGDAASLASRIETLLSQKDVLQAMGAAGRERFENNFGVDSMLWKTWCLYTEEAPELRFSASLQHLKAALETANQATTENREVPQELFSYAESVQSARFRRSF